MNQAIKYMLKKFAVFAVLTAMFSALAYPVVVNPKETEALKSNDCLNMGSADAQITVSGNVATAKFRIPVTNPRCLPRDVTLASYTAPNPTDGKPYAAQKLYQHTTKTYRNSGPHSISVAIPDCFYQIDLARGGVISSFANTTYYQETRLLGAKHGGNKSCEPAKPQQNPTPPPPPPVIKTIACSTISSKNLTETGKLPAKIEFNVQTTATNGGTATGYKYDYGDGKSETSASATATHEYTGSGKYKVTVTVLGASDVNVGAVCTTDVEIDQETKIVTVATTKVVEKPAEPALAKALPNTGPGDAIAIGSLASTIATFGHMLLRRKNELLASFIARF